MLKRVLRAHNTTTYHLIPLHYQQQQPFTSRKPLRHLLRMGAPPSSVVGGAGAMLTLRQQNFNWNVLKTCFRPPYTDFTHLLLITTFPNYSFRFCRLRCWIFDAVTGAVEASGTNRFEFAFESRIMCMRGWKMRSRQVDVLNICFIVWLSWNLFKCTMLKKIRYGLTAFALPFFLI